MLTHPRGTHHLLMGKINQTPTLCHVKLVTAVRFYPPQMGRSVLFTAAASAFSATNTRWTVVMPWV